MKRMLLKAAVALVCSAGLVGCAEDIADLMSKDPSPKALTPPNEPPLPPPQVQAPAQAPVQTQMPAQVPSQMQNTAYRELPPLGSSPGAAPCSPSPGNWR